MLFLWTSASTARICDSCTSRFGKVTSSSSSDDRFSELLNDNFGQSIENNEISGDSSGEFSEDHIDSIVGFDLTFFYSVSGVNSVVSPSNYAFFSGVEGNSIKLQISDLEKCLGHFSICLLNVGSFESCRSHRSSVS